MIRIRRVEKIQEEPRCLVEVSLETSHLRGTHVQGRTAPGSPARGGKPEISENAAPFTASGTKHAAPLVS